jgi:hypothetical protein
MTEKYLHYVWENKRFPIEFYDHLLQLGIEVIDFGVYNAHAAGPDFFNAKLKHEDLLWNGHIELHVHSSDWYKHGHDRDSAYDNVILHVVFVNDQPVYQLGNALLTVELQPFLDENDFKRFRLSSSARSRIWCANQLDGVDMIFPQGEKFRMVFNRMQRKINRLNAIQQARDKQQVFYELLAHSLFGSTNYIPASELTTRYPIEQLRLLKLDEQDFLLKVGSAFYSCEDDFIEYASRPHIKNYMVSCGQVAFSSWNRGALRPKTQPSSRLLVFIELVQLFDWNWLTNSQKTLIELVNYFAHWLSTLERGSSTIKETIMINCIVPFTLWLEQNELIRKGDSYNPILQLLESIPVEKNQKVLSWKKLGIRMSSAFDSQHILEQFDQFCAQKKCLSCTIGKQLLGNENDTKNPIFL